MLLDLALDEATAAVCTALSEDSGSADHVLDASTCCMVSPLKSSELGLRMGSDLVSGPPPGEGPPCPAPLRLRCTALHCTSPAW